MTLRQADSPNVVKNADEAEADARRERVAGRQRDVQSAEPDRAMSVRTAPEATIMHSDNTGTDMSLKHAGPEASQAMVMDAVTA
jgi:beta-lactamase class A